MDQNQRVTPEDVERQIADVLRRRVAELEAAAEVRTRSVGDAP